MGKIRVKTLGDEEAEKNQKNQAKKRKESKKLVKGAHGGERVVAVGPSEEELVKLDQLSGFGSQLSESGQPVIQSTGLAGETLVKTGKPKTEKQKSENRKQKTDNRKARSKTYQTVAKLVDRSKTYSLTEALELLPRLKWAKFDETVELHVNTTESGITGTVNLPHGTGKHVRVAVADDKLIANVEKGIIDFDVLLATPEMMPKLSKVAKFLGPKGLMPNPKNGTITKNPEEAAQKYAGGHMTFKTESKLPVIHLSVGKISFGEKKLEENISTIINAVQPNKIKNVTLKSTMSPGIKIQI